MAKKTNKTSKANLEAVLLDLQQMGVRHTLKSCTSSSTIKVEGGKRPYFFPNGEPIDPQYLQFIKSVKKEVCENAEMKQPPLKEETPKFIRFSPLFSDSFYSTDFVEIDISGAYWFTAYDYGLLTRTTYEAGLLVPKRVRLMALGSAATTKDVSFFDGTEYKHLGVEFNKYGRMAFFAVAKRVDEIMNNALDILHGNAVFYWVDALFVRKNFAAWAAQSIRDYGYEVKETPLLWLLGDRLEKKISGCRNLGERTLSNGYKIVCWEFKTYFKPRKISKNSPKST